MSSNILLCIAKFKIEVESQKIIEAPLDGFEITAPSLRHALKITEKLQNTYNDKNKYKLVKLGFSHYFNGSESEWEITTGIFLI